MDIFISGLGKSKIYTIIGVFSVFEMFPDTF